MSIIKILTKYVYVKTAKMDAKTLDRVGFGSSKRLPLYN